MRQSNATPVPEKYYALVIFDMDGTLTEEALDFAAIRRAIGVPEKAPILEHIARLEGEARRRAQDILERYEMAAAAASVVHEGAVEVLAALQRRGVRTALLTRNSAASVRSVLTRHGLTLDAIATREDAPHKPHRDSILNLARRLGILPEQTLMVGDYLYDVQAAASAGVDSALLWMKPGPLPEFAALATYVLRALTDVLQIVHAAGPE